MSALQRPKHLHNALYPRTRLFDEPRPPHGSGPLIAVALLAAAVGVFALTRSPAQPDATAVTEAVREELHTMFLADLGTETTVLRSGRTRPAITTRIDGLRLGDSVAVRCHGRGKLHITRLFTNSTRETRNVPCGRTALTHIVSEGTIQAVRIQADNKTSWASWAVVRPAHPSPAP